MSPWINTEQLVALIERSLAPGASVSPNLRLREKSRGARRQCDVVIVSGNPPRELTTIVEVQDRKTRTKIGELEGWLRKRDDLGANHLICVARHPYGRTLKEKAAMDGRVTLVTLRRLENATWPVVLQAIPLQLRYTRFAGYQNLVLREKRETGAAEADQAKTGEVGSNERCIVRKATGQWLTLAELANEHLEKLLERSPTEAGTHVVDFLPSGSDDFELERSDARIPFRFEGQAVLVVSCERVDATAYSYEQAAADDPDAWLLAGTAVVDSHRYELDLVLRPNGLGSVLIGQARLRNPRPGDQGLAVTVDAKLNP